MENERVEQGTIKMEKTIKRLSKSKVIGSFIGMGMVEFLVWNWTQASC